MITAVNTAQTSILAQIGNEYDNSDTSKLSCNSCSISIIEVESQVVVNANEDAYQDYIDANPDSF